MRMSVSAACLLALGSVVWAQNAPVVPDRDPAVDSPAKLTDVTVDTHPRLLFGKDQIETLRASAKGAGKPFFDQMLAYLPACNPPADTKYLTDATDGQRQGLWKLPTVSLHYVLTGDKKSLERSKAFLKTLVEQENWETGGELDSGMSAANIMIGAALAYDWLYNDLEPAFRDQVRAKLLLQARRMYYGGHLMKVGKLHYWQSDPHNNHRWHRDAGLALCALAVADSTRTDDDWIISKTLDELKFIHQWLPADGSSHESPSYLVFGGPYLALAFQAADRCLGTDLLSHDFFKTTAGYRLASVTPGYGDAFSYGDGAGFGHYNAYNFISTGRHKLADQQAGLLALYKSQKSAFEYGWMSLMWFDPSVSGGSADKVQKRSFFDDMGVAFLRDGWQKQDVGVMFKCSPYGGHILNEYRNTNGTKYINVAHDDPDANLFVLYARGEWLAANDQYAKTKLTSSHNTILVDGKGQKGEGSGWTQPLKGADADMSKLAVVTAWQDGGDAGVTAVEGEAARSYVGLKGYRRTVLWVPGRYVLLLDSIATDGSPRELTWNMQAPDALAVDAAAGSFLLKSGAAQCALRVASIQPFESKVQTSTAEHRGKALGFKQVRLGVKQSAWQLASAFDAWNHGDVNVQIAREGEALQVTVHAQGKQDVWTWKPAAGAGDTTTLTAKLASGPAYELKSAKIGD